MYYYIHLLCLFLSLGTIEATLSDTFRQFIINNYGVDVERELSRLDVGGGGSFSGGQHVVGQRTNHRPVILVHGVGGNAGTNGQIHHYFLDHGYADEEVYGTTWGDGGATPILLIDMKCQYVQMIRMFITVVSQYTNSKVDVIAYSMGSPITRKAILGRQCGEELGPPLTHLIDTFIGVAGANFGSFLCLVELGTCNAINGLACDSLFLSDINNGGLHRYEGSNIYTIYSTGDDKVGYQACGRIASAIPGENRAFEKDGLNHDQVIFQTAPLQYRLITGTA